MGLHSATAILVLLAGLTAAGGEPAPRQATGAPPASLRELFADPLPYLGRRVSVQLQFHSAPATWNPYLTRFGSRDYAQLRAWSDEQFLWLPEEFEQPFVRLYVPRDSVSAETLQRAGAYQRFRAVVRVEQVFLGRPWAEVESLEPLTERLGEGTLLHASRGWQLVHSGEPGLARSEFTRAQVPGLPTHVRAELARLVRSCSQVPPPSRR